MATYTNPSGDGGSSLLSGLSLLMQLGENKRKGKQWEKEFGYRQSQDKLANERQQILDRPLIAQQQAATRAETARKNALAGVALTPDVERTPFKDLEPGLQDFILQSARSTLPDMTLEELQPIFDARSQVRGGVTPAPNAPKGMTLQKLDTTTPAGDKAQFIAPPAPLDLTPPKGTRLKTLRRGDNPSAEFDVEPPPLRLEPPAGSGLELQGVTVDDTGRPSARFGHPEETRAKLAMEELKMVGSMKQAKRDLQTIEDLFADVDDIASGPIVGRARKLVKPYDEQAQLIEQAVGAAVPNLARGVFREVGVLTDEDVARYKAQFPQLTDTPSIRQKKLSALRARLAEAELGMLKNFKEGGRAMGDLVPPAEDVQSPIPKFDSLEAAEAAGLMTGTKIRVYDPNTAKYRDAVVE